MVVQVAQESKLAMPDEKTRLAVGKDLERLSAAKDIVAAMPGAELGPIDVRGLRSEHVDLTAGWILEPREKTGVVAEVPLGAAMLQLQKALENALRTGSVIVTDVALPCSETALERCRTGARTLDAGDGPMSPRSQKRIRPPLRAAL